MTQELFSNRRFDCWLSFIIILMLVLVASGCSKTRFGGMTINDAFEDPAVVRLVEAALDGQEQEIKSLVKKGADVNYVGKEGVTPLFWVMMKRSKTGMKRLLMAGADPNYKAIDSRQYSAVNYAAGGDDSQFLEILLEYGGDPNSIKGDRGDSSLQVAIYQNRVENVKLLMKYGADINLPGSLRSTAAETAVKLNRFDLAVYLLEQGYNHDLQRLARLTEISLVDPDSEAQKWKLKLLEMLKQRGVKFPAFVRKKK